LADYGADVVWVEPLGGDPWRDALAVPYSVFNRRKRSLVCDLKDATGQETIRGLLATADLFLHSWRPGVAERLGLGYDQLHEGFPALVYCSISGFGLDGPIRDLPGYDALVHAAVGTMYEQPGHRDGPIFVNLPFASTGAAYLAEIGVLAALHRRHADGWGRHVETSLLDGLIAYMSQGWGSSDTAPKPIELGSRRFICRTFRCADDEYLSISTFGLGALDRLMRVLGLADRMPPVGTDVSVAITPDELKLLHFEVPSILETKPRSVWVQQMLEADIAAVPVLHPCEVFDEPQAVHNQIVVEITDPVLGAVQQVGPPIRFDGAPSTVGDAAAPTVGQHTQAILDELRRGAVTPIPAPPGPPDERPLLEDVKVLDLGHWYAGPYSSRLLADLGADVIKLESPTGDGMRGFERSFSAAQAGKRSIAVDLKEPDLQALAEKLIGWADIVQHNLRHGVAERLDIDYERARGVNPRVIYQHAPGWGTSGPDTYRQTFAPLMSGYVGASFEISGQYNDPLGPIANEDSGSGMLGAVSLLMALVHRDLTGNGLYLELPQLNATMSDMEHLVRRTDGQVLGSDQLDPLQTGTGPLHRLYQTADDWICLAALTDDHIRGLGQALQITLLDDERFTTRRSRVENAYPLERLLADAIAAHPTAQLLSLLSQAGVPAIQPEANGNVRFLDDPANHRNGRVAAFRHPRYGDVREPAVMLRVSGTTIPDHQRAPELGEHTDAVLAWAGYTPEHIDELRAKHTIA
jgi:crotonobetainyl-CoA:carnitine CoA-transferase CaiB-like acyl-CoA transferase